MKKSVSLHSIIHPIATFFSRYHVVFFSIIVIGCLSTALVLLMQTLNISASETGYAAKNNYTSFDQATIKDINTLKKSSEQSSEFAMPAGRTNPFFE